MVRIGAFPHNAAMQNKSVLILNHADRLTELLRDAGLALGIPAGMWPKDRKPLLSATRECHRAISINNGISNEQAAQFTLCGFNFSRWFQLKILPNWSQSGVLKMFGRVFGLVREFFSTGQPPLLHCLY